MRSTILAKRVTAWSVGALLVVSGALGGCGDDRQAVRNNAPAANPPAPSQPAANPPGNAAGAAGAGSANAVAATDAKPDAPGKGPTVPASAGPATLPSAAEQTTGEAGRFALAYPTGDRASSVVLLEKVGPPQVRVGQRYQYDIKVTNLTDKPLGGVTVVESLAQGFELEASEPTTRPASGGDVDLRLARWFVGELGPKQSKTIRVTAVPGEVGTLAACLAVTYQPALCTTVEVVNPQLKLTKSGPSQAHICDRLQYKYVVTNAGTGVAKGVVVNETLPDGLTTEDGKTEVVVNVGDLAAGQSKDFAVAMKPAKAGEFTSRAVAKSEGGADEAASGKVTTVIRQPVLAVEASGPEWQYLGDPVTFNVVVSNKGDAPARDAVLNLNAPGLAEDARVRKLGEIGPGQSQSVSVTVEGTGAEDLKLEASAASECAPAAADAAVTRVKTIPALLLETVDNTDPVRVGETATYTVTVKNQGSAPAKNVALVAELPAELQFVEGSGQTGVKADGQKLTFAPIAALAPGEVATWWVQAKATKAADVRFRVELSSDYLSKPVPEVEPTRLY